MAMTPHLTAAARSDLGQQRLRPIHSLLVAAGRFDSHKRRDTLDERVLAPPNGIEQQP
jgi:hypothetical protein